MRRPEDWMQLPTDERILEILSTGLIFSPKVIAVNIDRGRSHVNRRLKVLVEKGFVNQVDRGYYEISETGREYLEGELDASDLDVDEE
ncbi:transcriptional regulator [Halomontanus rarus]|uniref:transcriptional regulator n=1 Tax=Halomontanus rarus TaxID=3034020 RepID=UPI0023E86D79|nr:transcriptional regulator [Halovivax sp. TS33]